MSVSPLRRTQKKGRPPDRPRKAKRETRRMPAKHASGKTRRLPEKHAKGREKKGKENLRAMLSISGYLSGPFTFNLPGVELLWRCKQRHSTANDQSSPNNRFPVPLSRVSRAISSFFLSPIPRPIPKPRLPPPNPFPLP